MLELDRIDVHYAKNHVLKGVSLNIREGEVVSLVGSNAAGKTTTLRTIMGLKACTAGTIRFAGASLEGQATDQRVAGGIVLVPEGRQVFPRFTVSENLLMGAYHRRDRNRLDDDLDKAYAMFPRLAERRGQKAGSMSGGEQQMLAIARGLLSRPRCLLLDEPTLGLAPRIVDEISLTIRKLAEQGLTVLLAEQNAGMALAVADRAYVLETGRVSLEGTGAELAGNEAVRRNYLDN
ncbi:MAG: ABC transporter ATP-binding protein [Proteobacteria bacterium]|jgi:branched-chain amino acid transport system ATP-binding protein|nr:ABC transporter ATP-binding protein [Pseudomonadota bacterium]